MKLGTFVIVVASLTACGKKDSSKGGGSGSGETKSGLTTSVTVVKPNAVDPAIVDLAKKVVAGCKWNDDGYYPMECEARKPWDAKRFEKDQAATLVAILEDPAVGMKWLAAAAMRDQPAWFSDSKEMQEKILAVASALPADMKGGTANKIGHVIGFFDFTKTGLLDKAKAIVEKADANEDLRVGIVNWLLAGNPKNDAAYTLTLDQAQKGATPGIKLAALVALSGAYNTHATDEMCKAWLDALPTLEGEGAAMIACHLTKGDLQINNQNKAFPENWAMISSDTNKCPPATVDAALKLIAERVKSGKAGEGYYWTTALTGPGKSKNATPEQKTAAVEIAKDFADNTKYGGYQRGSALEALVDLDPAVAKTYADKYAADADGSLKSASERVTKKLAEKK